MDASRARRDGQGTVSPSLRQIQQTPVYAGVFAFLGWPSAGHNSGHISRCASHTILFFPPTGLDSSKHRWLTRGSSTPDRPMHQAPRHCRCLLSFFVFDGRAEADFGISRAAHMNNARAILTTVSASGDARSPTLSANTWAEMSRLRGRRSRSADDNAGPSSS